MLFGLNKVQAGFKPCYKWIPFNTYKDLKKYLDTNGVLNLVINGYPSIPLI